jgi:hypothetical protein
VSKPLCRQCGLLISQMGGEWEAPADQRVVEVRLTSGNKGRQVTLVSQMIPLIPGTCWSEWFTLGQELLIDGFQLQVS